MPNHTQPRRDYSRDMAREVAKILMDSSLSQKNFSEVCTSLFGKRLPSSNLTFKAVSLSPKTTDAHDALKLETILACVELELGNSIPEPHDSSIDLSSKEEARKERSDNIVKFFEWLREKGVKRIVKLVVNDDLNLPCRDEIVEECLTGFDVRYLDWNKDDICIQSLKKKAENLRELWVSWSGRNSTLFGWSNREHGLRSLSQLRRFHFSVKMGLESNTRNTENILAFKRYLANSENAPYITVGEPSDERKDSKLLPNPQEASDDGNLWLKAVDDFVHVLKRKFPDKIRKNMKNPITIALIDDGVTLQHLSSPKFIPDGWFPDTQSPEHRSMNAWYFSEDGHGTEMARLIQQVCPFVTIYVAKLDTRKRVYNSVAASAVEAMKRAIEANVNIISMSWNLYKVNTVADEEDFRNLKSCIEEAARKDILLYCAAQDMGQLEGSTQPFPASFKISGVKRIGSAKIFGDRSDSVNPENIDYLFPGEIATTQGKQWGSSAATALASGLAALILWCAEAHRMLEENSFDGAKTNPATEDFYFQKEGRMDKLFDGLKTATSFVNIRNILNYAKDQDDCAGKLFEYCKRKMPDSEHFNFHAKGT